MDLLLMRHAKSSWDDPGLADYDRPLNARGRRAAPLMADHLERMGFRPDRILTSGALRARETAAVIGSRYGITPEVREDLYLAGVADWKKVLREQPRGECLLAVGHNPGLEELIEEITGEKQRLPTAAVALLEVIGERGPIVPSGLRLVTVWRPKELAVD